MTGDGKSDRWARLFDEHGGSAVAPDTPLGQVEHLLKVAGSVAADAQGTWADLWDQMKPHITPGGVVLPEMEKGFVPACGWPEFLEKFWLLKHYLDSAQRLCCDRH